MSEMHSNAKRLGTIVLGSVFAALIFAAPSAWADDVAQIGTDKYPDLATAIGALSDGQTLELLCDYFPTEDEATNFPEINANATIDLGGHTLTLTNWIWASKKFVISADKTVTFQNGVLDMPGTEGVYQYGIQVYGTLNANCLIKRKACRPVFDIYDSATVNTGDDTLIDAFADIFRFKTAGTGGGIKTPHVNVSGGVYTNSTASGNACGVFYVYKEYNQPVVTITGGEFSMIAVKGDNPNVGGLLQADSSKTECFYNCSLGADCNAKFSRTENTAGYIADGYQLKLVDGWYRVMEKPPAVQVADAAGYTNLNFIVDVETSGEYTITAKTLDGTTVGSVVKTIDPGLTPFEVATDAFGDSFETGKTYVYTVTASDSSVIGSTAFTDAGTVTNDYFSAKFVGGADVYVNGNWVAGLAPTIGDGVFKVDSTQTVFHVANDGVKATRKVVTVNCVLNIDSFYYLDDITNDVLSATAALALVTNEEAAASASWMAMTNGNKWVELTGAPVQLGDYEARIELDYNTAQPYIRYSVRSGSGSWKTLKAGGTEWFLAQNNAPTVSNVCFVGKSDVTSLIAKLSTTGVAEVNGLDSNDILAAMDVARTQSKEVVLYTNIKLDPPALKTRLGTYTFNFNGKTFTLNPYVWTVGDGSATGISIDGNELTVENQAFVACIGSDASTSPAFTYLNSALAAGANTNVLLRVNLAESVTSEVENVTLDLAGHSFTKSGGSTAPILLVKGGSLCLIDSSVNKAGELTGAAGGSSAIAVENGAKVYVGDAKFTGNDGTLFTTAGTGTGVVISNGFFYANNGNFASGNGSGVLVLNGFLGDNCSSGSAYGSVVKAIGGYYTADSFNMSLLTNAATDRIVGLAVPVTTNSVTFGYTIGLIIKDEHGDPVAATAYVVTNEQGEAQGSVQLPDGFVSAATDGKTGPAAQAELQKPAAFKGGAAGMTKWHTYVLGMPTAAVADTTEGPYVKGVQDTEPSKIGFQMLTPAAVKAAESGTKVEYQVEAYDNPDFTGTLKEVSEKVDYTKTAEIGVPASGVRYYKLKVFITPKK